MANSVKGRFKAYFEVLLLFFIAAVLLPVTLFSNPLLLIKSPSMFRDKWFEKLWNIIGASRAGKPIQVSNIGELMGRARGIVLEIGPGTGEQAFHFKPAQITKVYGAEPNEFLHGRLVEKSTAAGLGGKYIPMVAGAEPNSLLPALQKQGLIAKGATTLPEGGIFDSIVSIKVLCSVPPEQHAATTAILQRLLKSGGEFLFFEHVENNTDTLTQWIVTLFGWMWPYFTGGCHLTSKLDSAVMKMGGWSEREVRTTSDFQGYEIIRYVRGICKRA